MDVISSAAKVFSDNFDSSTCFERALFLSWYCSKGDCKFCYMSTQKPLIKDPMKSRRSFESIYAEAHISRACGWEIEFLSGGYESFSVPELVEIAKNVSSITGKKQWLNLGVLSEDELQQFLPYAEGYVGTLECVNLKLRAEICPSKPLEPIIEAFAACDKLGLQKAVTVIIGLGETFDDFEFLKSFITEHGVSRITFYSLNPQKGTPYTESPSVEYYEEWIAKTRIAFPKLHIVAGAWVDKIEYYSRLLLAGANTITKLPATKLLGTEKGQQVIAEAEKAGRKFIGSFDKPEISYEGMDAKVTKKIKEYL